MNVVMGANGHVGQSVVKQLIAMGKAVTAVVREEKKAEQLKQMGADVAVADAKDLPSLMAAFEYGDVLFVITPEELQSNDILADNQQVLKNYHEAIRNTSIRKVVGISSAGAQHASGTGNLQMSYQLEHAFEDLNVTQIFVRPAYYFSNWMASLPTVKEQGVLPTFFPADLPLPMIAPEDVGKLCADLMVTDEVRSRVYELQGSGNYTSNDVAAAFGQALGKTVTAQQIPHEQWAENLKKMGMTDNGIKNFMEMTDAAINGRSAFEGGEIPTISTRITLQQYINEQVKEAVDA